MIQVLQVLATGYALWLFLCAIVAISSTAAHADKLVPGRVWITMLFVPILVVLAAIWWPR